MTPDQRAGYRQKLLEPENAAYLMAALNQMPTGRVRQVYQVYFHARAAQGVLLLRADLNKISEVRDEHILEALERIRLRESKLLGHLAASFVDTFAPTLERLELNQPAEDMISDAVLEVAQFLVEPSVVDRDEVMVARVSRFRDRIVFLEEQVRFLVERNSELDTGLNSASRKLEAQEREAKKRLKLELEQREADWKHRLEVQQRLQSETHQRQMADLRHQFLQTADELAFMTGQLDLTTDELEVKASTEADARIALEAVNQDLQRQLSRQELDLEINETERVALNAVIAELERQLEETRRDANDKAERLNAHDCEKDQAPAQIKLDQALIVNYRGLASTPAERLLLLFRAYRAFLNHDNDDPALTLHSNLGDFKDQRDQIRGILVLGIEQLLLDGVNLPLEQLLSLRVAKRESVLKQLLGALESPRLKDLA